MWLVDLFKKKEKREPEVFHCPECGSEDFFEGPHGGSSINFCCADCHARFNHTGFGIERYGFVSDEDLVVFRFQRIKVQQAPLQGDS